MILNWLHTNHLQEYLCTNKSLETIFTQFSHHYVALLAIVGDGGDILALIMVNQKPPSLKQMVTSPHTVTQLLG